MPKITFMGAGSTVFAKNVLGDCMMTPVLENSDIALYDIDPVRLDVLDQGPSHKPGDGGGQQDKQDDGQTGQEFALPLSHCSFADTP